MKTITLIKQFAFSVGIVAGMNVFASCNSCDRKTQTTTESTTVTYEDTVSTNETTTTVSDGTTTSTSINATGSGSGSTKKPTSTSSGTTGSGSSATTAKDEAARQQAITDRIENSDVNNAVDKNGNPLRSSGAASSGSGTGTGSTGNNSKVTTREAQRTN